MVATRESRNWSRSPRPLIGRQFIVSLSQQVLVLAGDLYERAAAEHPSLECGTLAEDHDAHRNDKDRALTLE